MLLGLEKTRNQVEIHNIGSEDQTNVKTIAEIVVKEMKLKNVKLKFTGGVDGGRGWKGDVKNMLLDMARSNPKNENPNFTARGRSNPHARRKPNTSQRMIKKEFFFLTFHLKQKKRAFRRRHL